MALNPYTKQYTRTVYKNYPDTSTPLNETNLNKIDSVVDIMDDQLVAWETTKANQTDMLQAVKLIQFNSSTGVFTITFFNNTTTTIDTDIEKIAINFDYDDDPTSAHYQQIIIQLDDGTYKYIDLSALITQYEFTNSSTIAFTNTGGNISANVVDGSITESKLQPNYLADCKAEVRNCQTEVTNCQTQVGYAQDKVYDAEAWAVGTRNGTAVESTDPTYHNNSKYHSEISEDYKEDAEAWSNGQINGQDVPSTHPAYHNNAKYYKDLANPTTFKSLTDVDTDQSFVGIDLQGITDGQTMIFNNTSKKLVPGDSAGNFAQLKDVKLEDTVSELDTIEYHLDYDTNKLVLQNKTFTRNMIKYPYKGTNTTTAGVQIYADKDGSIHVEGTANDTTTTSYQISSNAESSTSTVFCIDNNVYKFAADISGTITDGSSNPVPLSNYLWDASTVVSKKYGASSETFTLSNSVTEVSVWKRDADIYYVKNMRLTIPLTSGHTYNLVFKLSFFRAGIPGVDKIFNRHTMTNQELTDNHNVKDMFDTNISNPTPGQTLVYNSKGKLENATPSGAGHTMVNNAGTALTPRTNLQTVGGLNATDDSANNTTKITDVYEEVPWATWNGYPSEAAAAQAHPNCVVTGAPDCDGDVEIEFEKVLWTNQSPSSSFAAARITLNSDDYDDYGIEYAWYVSRSMQSVKVAKGSNMNLYTVQNISSSVRTATRNIVYVDATHLDIEDATIMETGGSMTTNNGWCVPIRVIGYKKDLTAKIQAIAHNVSTEASKCMLSDEETSVEDAITALSKKYKLIYNSGKFTADNTVALTDNVGDFKFLVARTGNSSDSSSSRSFGILPSMVASMGCYLPYNKGDKFLRINASSTSFRLIECTSGEYIYQIYGVY